MDINQVIYGWIYLHHKFFHKVEFRVWINHIILEPWNSQMIISNFLLLIECPDACQSDRYPVHYYNEMTAKNNAPWHI